MPRVDVPDGPGGPPVQVWNLRPELLPTVQAMIDGPYHRSQLPAREREAARVRIAELNDCSICRDYRARSVVAAGATEDLYEHLGAAHAHADYTDRERLAIEFAERFALDHAGINDELFVRLRASFSDAEVVDLAICCGVFLGLGRVLAVLGIDAADASAEPQPG